MGIVKRRQALWIMLALPLNVFANGPAHPCAPVLDPTERLACYDKAFPPPPAVHEAAAKRVVDGFGRAPQSHARGAPTPSGNDRDRIEAKVAKVVHSRGSRTITLDNGQVWALTEATTRGPIAEGDAVAVRRAALGNYILVTAAGVGLRARRVR